MFDVLKKLSWFFKENRQRYTIAVLLLLATNVFAITPPFLLGKVIDTIHAEHMTTKLLIFFIVTLTVVLVLNYITNFVWQYQLFGGAFVIERQLRSRLMKKFLSMCPPFYERNKTGDLMARSTNDLQAISETAGFGILTLVDSTAFLLMIIGMMGFVVSWKLTFFALLPLPVLAFTMQVLGKKIHERYIVAQAAFGELNDHVLEGVEGVRVVRAYVLEREKEQQFAQMTEDVYEKNMAVEKIDALFMPITKILTTLTYIIGLSYGAYLVFKNELTLGELVTFNVYLGMLVWPMFAIGELINVLQRGNASLDRVQETLDTKNVVKSHAVGKTVQQPTNITFDHVTFQYPQSINRNLSNISVEIRQGETLGIVGKTGSGKTTFIKQLLREYPTGEGKLVIAGVPIEEIDQQQLKSWIGYVPQEHILFSRSIRQNLLFGNEHATDDEIVEAIQLAHFEQDVNLLPNKLETIVGEKGVALSGGQKQRLSIARALLKNPEILLLDDSLSAVDSKTETAIIENIQRLRNNKTTIISTHRLSAVQHADRIIVLEDGVIVEEGTHEQLLRQDGWYKEQYDRQQLEGGVDHDNR